MRIAYYISGHGYGHATRSCVVADALAHEHTVTLVTPVPESFLRSNLRHPCAHRAARLDVGVIQPDSMTIDYEATLAALEDWKRHRAGSLEEESRWLESEHIDRVLVDVPSIGCAAAKRAGVPVAVITNFTWDDVYREYPGDGFETAARIMAEDYTTASGLFPLPFATSMRALERRWPFGMVARVARLDRETVRNRLDIGRGLVALLSYGGLGLGDTPPQRWSKPDDWELICVEDRCPPPGIRTIGSRGLAKAGVHYSDLVGAVDAVLTKPGYGITTDCMANHTAIVYTDRGQFAEYERLVEGIQRYLPNAYLPQERLREGRLAEALEAIRSVQWPSEKLDPLRSEQIRERLHPFLDE